MRTILVVDDDADMRHVLVQFVKEIGHSYLMAAHGREALEVLKTNAIDLVITDVQMPVMSGMELLETIRRESQSQIPVIVMTGHFDFPEDRVLALGASGILYKPCSIDALRAKVSEFLGAA